MTALKSYQNIYLRNLDINSYSTDTPVEELIRSGRFYHTKYFNYHLSDILRFLTLWKYGGVYLDLDVVMLKSLEQLGSDYLVAESNTSVSSSGVYFSSNSSNNDGLGHKFAEMCLQELAINFKGSSWNRNGPGLLTRVLHKWCGFNSSKINIELLKPCSPVKILPKETFLPVDWSNNGALFSEKELKSVLDTVSAAYSVHIYNHINSKKRIKKGSNVAYDYLARRHCPRVYAVIDDYW